MVVCLGAIAFLSFRSVTASGLFGLARVEVYGTKRSAREAIERVVHEEARGVGVWNADLWLIRARIEKLQFVRSAAVTRVLPDRIRVRIFEHEPQAVVRTAKGHFLVAQDGTVLASTEGPEGGLPFVMTGWDEERSEKADRENAERVKLYQRALQEWNQLGLTGRVRSIDTASLREPRAAVEDSGLPVTIAIGRDNFGENLGRGLRAIAGKGDIFEGVDLIGANLVLAPRKAPVSVVQK